MNVENVMTRAPRTCSRTDHLHQAAQLMWDNDCGVVPVIESDGRLAGILTDRDACMAGLMQGRALHDIPVEQAMSRTIFTLAPEAPVQDAIALFQERQVRRIPVVDAAGILVGILSMSDLVCASSDGKIGKRARPEHVMRAVEAVSRPRRKSAVAAPDTLDSATGTLFPQAPTSGRSRKSPRSKPSKRAPAKSGRRR